MPRDREADREKHLALQQTRECTWASSSDEIQDRPYTYGGVSRRRPFFNLATNDLGATVVVAAALSLLAILLWATAKLSLVSYTHEVKMGTCTILAKELQHIHIPVPGVDFWRAAINVSLAVDTQRKPATPALPPGAPTTCWSDGVPHPCEAPEPPPPRAYEATAYNDLKGTFDPDREEQQAVLDAHRVGERYPCFFGRFATDEGQTRQLSVVFSVTRALHAGNVKARGQETDPWFEVARNVVSVGALTFSLLVCTKLALGRWQKEAPSEGQELTSRTDSEDSSRGSSSSRNGHYGPGEGLTWRHAAPLLAYSTRSEYSQLSEVP